MADEYHTDIRLQLLAAGYVILPNHSKACFLKGWADPKYVQRELSIERVKRWPKRFPQFKATGVRIQDGLCVADWDIDDGPMIERMWARLAQIAPDVAARAPTRFGGGEHKLALFMQIDCPAADRWHRKASRKFFRPGEEPGTHDGHMIEIYGGGGGGHQFGIYGPHSYNDDGTLKRSYVWATETPDLAGTTIPDLPSLSTAQANALIDAFEEEAIAAGWTTPSAACGMDSGEPVYDIDEHSRFDTNKGGSNLTYEELTHAHAAHGDLRCAATFMPGRGSHNRERCWVYRSPRHDCVAVYVYGDEQIHYPKSVAPHLDRVAEHLKDVAAAAAIEGREPPPAEEGVAPQSEPDAAAPVFEKAGWLLASYGYCAIDDLVIELMSVSMQCGIRPGAFERRFRAWYAKPAQGKGKPVFATELWNLAIGRVHIEGVRMRPDRPFPTYQEGGRTFKNTYRAPQHPTSGGDTAEFERFLQRFLPDPVEREFQLDWMAHKLARPDIPGTSIVFVADQEDDVREGRFGTGRGLFFRIAHKLYGEQYARAQSFNVLDGSSSQAGFTDWMHGSLLVTVDESRTSPTAYRRGERNAVYDVLKDIVDPAPKRMTFKGKYRQAFDGMSYCSFWIAANHADAVAIPENDRRFSVLRNGRVITPDEAIAIDRWMADPANIGALARMLAARPLAGFNMFQPLATAAKQEMAELARSDVEHVLRDMMADKALGAVFLKRHLEEHVARNFNAQDTKWRGDLTGAWNRYCAKVPSGTGGDQRRLRYQGTMKRVFCFRSRLAEVRRMPEATLRREAAKWGPIDKDNPLSVIDGLPVINPKDEGDQ